MINTNKKFTRRLVNYLYQCSPEERIAAADFLRERLKENKETNEQEHLLKVPIKLRKHYTWNYQSEKE